MNVIEWFISFDFVEIDDSKFQVGLTERERHFVNFLKAFNIVSSKSIYVSPEVKNDPAFIIFMGIESEGTMY